MKGSAQGKPARGRKAQITVFMIIGIILLFSTSLIFYIRGQLVEDMPTEAMEAIEDVPIQAQPIQIYVENCIQKVAREAFEKAGLHGGYIDPTDDQMSGDYFIMDIEPVEADGVTMFGRQDTFIPYWYYLKSSTTCQGACEFDSHRPPMRKTYGQYSVEDQVDTYITKHLPECIDDFRSFTEQGFSFEVGDIRPDTRISEKDVGIIVVYPIKATRQGQSTDLTRFFARIDLNFADIYAMATNITQTEIDKLFLEQHTLNQITLYSMPMSMDRLPPVAEYTIDPNEFMFWSTQDVKNKVQNYVLPNAMGQLQVNYANNFKRVVMFKDDENGHKVYDHLGTRILDGMVIPLETNFTNLDARFDYLPMWNIFLNINNQEVLTASSMSSPLLSFIGVNQYEFLYTLSYPVMVTLRDNNAFLGDGYEFRFALEHNMRDNQPITTNSTKYLAQEQGTLVCDMNNMKSAPVTIEVKEYGTGKPIENARISLVFGKEGCRAGLTEIKNNHSTIETRLPVGLGELTISHMDYIEQSARFFASPDKEKEMVFELMPYKYMNVTAFARTLNFDTATGKYALPSGNPMSSMLQNEQWMFIFERVDEDTNKDYKAYANGRGPFPAIAKLIPGTYSVRGYIMLNQTIIIPKEEMEVGGSIWGGDDTVEINETIIDTWQSGGVIMDNETGYFEITYDQLFGKQRLNMFLLRFPLPETHTTEIKNRPSLEQAGMHEEYSIMYRPQLEPQWIP